MKGFRFQTRLFWLIVVTVTIWILPLAIHADEPSTVPSVEADESPLPTDCLNRAEAGAVCDNQPAWGGMSLPQTVIPKIMTTGYIKGLYITYNGLGSDKLRTHVQNLLETTELNAIVMDVKGDRGLIPYPSHVQLAIDIGAAPKTMIADWPGWMQWFKDRNIYTIARLVVFKDEPLAAAHPEWAVTDSETGEIWRDREGLGWTDPTRTEVWDYNIALAIEAARMGFDEIQFDYVRFPSDGSVKKAAYSVEDVTQEIRIDTISHFLAKAKAALEPYNVKVAADVFGQTAWHRRDDMGIGQYIDAMAPHLDVLSPMLYPSTFADGLPKHPEYRNAIEFPYEVYYLSIQQMINRLQPVNPALEIRPWVQDFPDYTYDRRIYTPDEIRAQMEGARQAGGRGWMLWDPRVKFTPEALVSATPALTPNLQGRVLVLEYHRIGEPEGRWQRTPANFRADLNRLLAGGYYPVNLRDMVEGKLDMVPAGKRPIVLTFDDSTAGQFRLLPDGTVDPNSAVGILLEMHRQHPADWPLKATFFVLPDAGNPNQFSFHQPEWGHQKLQLLVDWGMEVGSHTLSHANLSHSPPEEVQQELARSQAALQAALPGYQVVSLSIPYGAYPESDELLAGEYEGLAYHYKAAVEVSGGFAPSPHSLDFNPWHIPRVQAIQSELDAFLKRADTPGFYYVSAGE